MLVIDKYTMCFKPALFDASTTRRITPDRNSPISSPSAGHGEDASIATSAPAKAASKPSPVVISTPVERDISTASWPAALICSTTLRPAVPDCDLHVHLHSLMLIRT